MRYRRFLPLGAGLLGVMLLAQAQPSYSPYAYNPAQAAPPSWSYDPYTSGFAACPQWHPGDLPCRDTMEPTYGQPDFRAR